MCGEHQSQTQGCGSGGRARRGCSVPAKSQQLLKHLPAPSPGLCRLPVSARVLCTGGEGKSLEKDGICATLLENHLGIQVFFPPPLLQF